MGLFGFCDGDHADGEVCSRGADGLAGEVVCVGVGGDASTEDAVCPVLQLLLLERGSSSRCIPESREICYYSLENGSDIAEGLFGSRRT